MNKRYHHIEWFLGFDSWGDSCIFGHWVSNQTGEPKRYLQEEEIQKFVEGGGRIELR